MEERPSILRGLGMFIVGSAMLAFAIAVSWDQIVFDRHSRPAEAVVESFQAGRRGAHSAGVRYELDGKTIAASMLRFHCHPGDKVAIRYDPANPNFVQPESHNLWDRFGGMLLMGGAGRAR